MHRAATTNLAEPPLSYCETVHTAWHDREQAHRDVEAPALRDEPVDGTAAGRTLGNIGLMVVDSEAYRRSGRQLPGGDVHMELNSKVFDRETRGADTSNSKARRGQAAQKGLGGHSVGYLDLGSITHRADGRNSRDRCDVHGVRAA